MLRKFICCICFLHFFIVALPALVKAAENAESEHTTPLSGKVISPVTRAEHVPFAAIVKEVLVSPGQSVMKNQVLMTYELTEDARRILEKEITLGAATEDINGQIVTLQGQLAELIAARNKARQLAASGLGSNQALKRTEGDLASLEKRIALLEQTNKKREANFAQRLAELSKYFGTTIHAGDALPQTLVLTSPMEGHVLSVDASVQPGSQLEAGFAPIIVGKMNPMLIQVQVYEAEVDRMKVGDGVQVTIPSLHDSVFNGTVSKISWTSTNLDLTAPSYFTVELTVPNESLQLKPGFKAIVKFGQ